ncbi:MAG: YaaL family protein [Firmicutes bacterium]|nr:YaaL family protein [Bacillota bacterium]
MDLNTGKKVGFFNVLVKNRLTRLLKEIIFLNIKKNTTVKNTVNRNYITDDDNTLIEDIRSAKNEWLNVDSNFQYVCENEIIDYYTYMLKAAQIKYEYYLKKAKERGLKVKYRA